MSQFYNLTVSSVTEETPQAICVGFDIAPELEQTFKAKHGQYLTLKQQINGEEFRRCYSVCSAVGEPLRVAIKKVDQGVFSNWANEQLKAGDTIAVAPPEGSFTTTLEPEKSKTYLCMAVGSGITPILSIAKTLLQQEPESHVTLLYGNQRVGTMMFKEELLSLKNRYMSRFQLINILSREEQDVEILNGRINNKKGGQLIARLLDLQAVDDFFLCGPESMISEVSRGLIGEGIPESKMHYELFASSAEDAQIAVAKHHARSEKHGGKVSKVSITLDGRKSTLDLAADGENILDAAMNHGMDVPFSCKGGVCATCRAKVLEGEVEMDLNHALSPEEVADGYILTCQAHPISETVVVNFDLGLS
jgi:ring-1,2-phenylacetyl-CoA epoxidase subunit PaaE